MKKCPYIFARIIIPAPRPYTCQQRAGGSSGCEQKPFSWGGVRAPPRWGAPFPASGAPVLLGVRMVRLGCIAAGVQPARRAGRLGGKPPEDG